MAGDDRTAALLHSPNVVVVLEVACNVYDGIDAALQIRKAAVDESLSYLRRITARDAQRTISAERGDMFWSNQTNGR